MHRPRQQAGETVSHDIPMAEHLKHAIAADWDPAPPLPHPARLDAAPYTARRRTAVSAQFRDRLIVVPAGLDEGPRE